MSFYVVKNYKYSKRINVINGSFLILLTKRAVIDVREITTPVAILLVAFGFLCVSVLCVVCYRVVGGGVNAGVVAPSALILQK